jgi:hypothetical protein
VRRQDVAELETSAAPCEHSRSARIAEATAEKAEPFTADPEMSEEDRAAAAAEVQRGATKSVTFAEYVTRSKRRFESTEIAEVRADRNVAETAEPRASGSLLAGRRGRRRRCFRG